jgi:NitT/TauT family transport system substrate-binding protein
MAAIVALPALSSAATVKIALPVASLESMPIYVAQDAGLFKKHGIDADIITSRGGGEAMKAYIAGEVQIVATGFPEVGLLRKRGVDVELFFQQTSRVPFSLIGRKDEAIKSVADLKGKTIAVTSPGSLTANITRYLVMKAGLNPDRDVSLISVGGGGEILGALKSKRADAAMLFEPFPSIAVKQNIATVILNVNDELDAFSASPLSTSKAFIKAHPKEAKGIFDALAEALAYIHDNKAGTTAIAKKHFPSAKPAVLQAALDHIYKVYATTGKFPRAHVERTQKICIQLKIMPETYPYDDIVAKMAQE